MLLSRLATLAMGLFLGRVLFLLLRGHAARGIAPSLFFPRCCPHCLRGGFERLADLPEADPPALLARCRECGTLFKLWYPGQWEVVAGVGKYGPIYDPELDPLPVSSTSKPTPAPTLPPRRSPTPSPPRRRTSQFTLRSLMIVVAIAAAHFLVLSRAAANAGAAGHSFGLEEGLSVAGLTLTYNALIYLYVRTVGRLGSGPSFFVDRYKFMCILLGLIIALTIPILFILFW